jgi:hypothetical protein
MDMHRAHREAKKDLEDARTAHDDHRDNYKQLRDRFIQDQEMDGNDLGTTAEDVYGPIYLSLGQKRVEELRVAEDKLLEIEKGALDAGISFRIDNDHARLEDHIIEINAEGKASMLHSHWEKVMQWMDTDMDAVSLARTVVDESEMIQDSDKVDELAGDVGLTHPWFGDLC